MTAAEQAHIQDRVNQPDPSSICRDLKMITFLVPAQTDPQLLQLIRDDRVEFELAAVLPDADEADVSNRFSFTYTLHPEESDEEEEECCCNSQRSWQKKFTIAAKGVGRNKNVAGRVKRLQPLALPADVVVSVNLPQATVNNNIHSMLSTVPMQSQVSLATNPQPLAASVDWSGEQSLYTDVLLPPPASLGLAVNQGFLPDPDWLSSGELPKGLTSSSSSSLSTWRWPSDVRIASSSSSSLSTTSAFELIDVDEFGPQKDDLDLFDTEVVPYGADFQLGK